MSDGDAQFEADVFGDDVLAQVEPLREDVPSSEAAARARRGSRC